jgi:hypothetical protein
MVRFGWHIACHYRNCESVEGGDEVFRRILISAAIGSLAVFAASCSNSDTTNSNVNANANSSAQTATTTTAPDNSEIATTNDNGVRTETRTFRNNPRVSKVVVTTRDGNRTVKVFSPNGEGKEMTSGTDKALTATGDAIADSVGFVKDKGSDVVDKTKEGTEVVVDKTKAGAKTAAEKTKEGADVVKDKTVETAKTAGEKTKSGAKTVIDKTAEGAKKTGSTIKKVIKP